jgi:hypothetical protein
MQIDKDTLLRFRYQSFVTKVANKMQAEYKTIMETF